MHLSRLYSYTEYLLHKSLLSYNNLLAPIRAIRSTSHNLVYVDCSSECNDHSLHNKNLLEAKGNNYVNKADVLIEHACMTI